jgi:hypothetical protein
MPMSKGTPYRNASGSSKINRPGHTGRAIYVLPIGALSRQTQLAADEGTREIFQAQAMDQAIDLRVDWDGDAANLGRFEVLVGPSAWKACALLEPHDVKTDVIVASMGGTTFHARFQRGPENGGCIFGVKAIPIVWKHVLPAQLDPSYVAQFGTDYEYEGGIQPALLPWNYSVPSGSVQRLTLELSMERRYELWVRLQDPKDPNKWHIQDPILDPIDDVAREHLQLVLEGDVTQLDPEVLQRIIEEARAAAGDAKLSILSITSGSILLELDVSAEGAAMLKRLFESGDLKNFGGLPILAIRYDHAKPLGAAPGAMPESPECVLADFFARAFGAEEIRRLVRSFSDGAHLDDALPGSSASLSHLASEAVRVLIRHDLVCAEFFERLEAERPRRCEEIRQIRRLF